ncbi:MAG TPA: hypothetical protein VKJ77_01320, partial [Caballeronia sp.]|nr:hypothetical protein [Caballeronia sp.]
PSSRIKPKLARIQATPVLGQMPDKSRKRAQSGPKAGQISAPDSPGFAPRSPTGFRAAHHKNLSRVEALRLTNIYVAVERMLLRVSDPARTTCVRRCPFWHPRAVSNIWTALWKSITTKIFR